MTRFTKETAFKVMSHIHIIPIKCNTIINTVAVITKDEKILKPVIINVITKTNDSEYPKDFMVSIHIDKYCS